MCIDLACITNQSSGRVEKEGGACADIRMHVAGVMGRDCSEGGACRAALQPQTHNFLSLQCTMGRGGGGGRLMGGVAAAAAAAGAAGAAAAAAIIMIIGLGVSSYFFGFKSVLQQFFGRVF